MESIGIRLQNLEPVDQVLSLGRLAEARSETGLFAPGDIDDLFDAVGLQRPPKTGNQMATLKRRGQMTSVKSKVGRAGWKLTPQGKQAAFKQASDLDLAVLMAQNALPPMSQLGHMAHPVIPPSLAPLELVLPIHEFCERYPFETNVFGMTRFPADGPSEAMDPVLPTLECARKVCRMHGLTFHLASDRKIVDDLWANVMAHIWASRYGVAVFEQRVGGLNYNLNIEVGSSLALGRRLAVLKDAPVKKLPTDLVGRIYHEIDLDNVGSVEVELHKWIRDDLRLGSCSECPSDANSRH
jgi:hypothetical protein